MIESASGLDNLDAILATPGLDGVYVGPNDLALSLGESPAAGAAPGRTAEALAHVARTARDAGRWAGVFCGDSEIALRMIELGYDLVTPGNDAGVMRQAAHERLAAVRGSR
jgi:4-hydroxy-2-oxoheptanedioate aldolase